MIKMSEKELKARAKEMKNDLKMYRVNYNDIIERVWFPIDADLVIISNYKVLDLFNNMCKFYHMGVINDKDVHHWMGWNYRTKEWDRMEFLDDMKLF